MSQETVLDRAPFASEARDGSSPWRDELAELLRRDDASLMEVVGLLRADLSLCRAVFRAATRARRPGAFPVDHLSRAVQVLGFRRILNLVESSPECVGA